MPLTQIEFTILFAAASGFLIFTPERLVLLRDLLFWAVLVLAAFHGHSFWRSNAWAERVASAFTTGRGLYNITSRARDKALSTWIDWKAQIQQRCTRFANALAAVVRRVTGPYSSNKTSSGADPSTRPTPGRQNYLAILVTTPPVHEYGPASERLYSTAPGRPGPISWVSTETDSIPPMLVSLVFRRHFAICLVAEAAWRSTTTTLQEKLAGQLFWDHCGDGEGSPGSRASTWTPGRIGQINALQVLGLVVADEDAAEICTSFHMKLKRIWGEYRNIWWNDADFALALGYLLVNDSVASVCRDIMQRRNELRTEVTELRRPARMMTNLANLGLSVGTVMLTTTVLAASPVAWPLGASAIWVSLWHAEQVQEQEQWQRRREACARLEEEFPGLQQLFV